MLLSENTELSNRRTLDMIYTFRECHEKCLLASRASKRSRRFEVQKFPERNGSKLAICKRLLRQFEFEESGNANYQKYR